MYISIALPAIIAFVVSLIAGPALIAFLHKLKFGQFIRDEGPKSHQKKSGTPTMGGILFLLAFLIGSVFFVRQSPKMIPVILVTLGFSLVGFLDDFIKVVMKRNLGLRAWQKFLLQAVITAFFAVYMVKYSGTGTRLALPIPGRSIQLHPLVYVPLLFLVILGTVNGSNFTDGLDGLASSVTAVITTFLLTVSAGFSGGIEPACSAMLGALLGFLWFNTYPAKVFMGDTGSLALGGFVASAAYMLGIPLLLPLIAIIYVAEVGSVMIQVAVYKKTRKRVFKMSPIHHHFELSGWPETRVVSIFTIVTAIACLAAYILI